MSKILVADDSSTIQKVISMTMQDSGYELISALNVEELFDKISDEIDVILLDYSISEQSGLEVAKKIHEQNSKVKIIALLSTFDQVDRAELLANGFSESITKPFDSTSFLNIVTGVVERAAESDKVDEGAQEVEAETGEVVSLKSDEESITENKVEEDQEKPTSDIESIDNWTTNDDDLNKDEEEKQVSADEVEEDNVVDIEFTLEDWGVEVPMAIDRAKASIELPPKIEEKSEEEEKFPQEEDLDYPEVKEVNASGEVEEDAEAKREELVEDLEELHLTSTPIKLEELTDSAVEENNLGEETDPNIGLSDYADNLDDLVSDETDGDELWSVDEGLKVNGENNTMTEQLESVASDVNLEEGKVAAEKLEPQLNEEAVDDEIIDAAVDETIHTAFNSFNRDEFLDEVKSELKQELLNSEEFKKSLIEELVSEVKATLLDSVRPQLDSIAWEVIPDLAENIIKQEIKKISETI